MSADEYVWVSSFDSRNAAAAVGYLRINTFGELAAIPEARFKAMGLDNSEIASIRKALIKRGLELGVLPADADNTS